MPKSMRILLLEDSPDDVYFVQRALELVDRGHSVHAVSDGEQGIAYLRGEEEYADRIRFPPPNVIFTDLKMPRMNGFEFLKWLRNHRECSVIPTIVLTSSALESDVRRAYELGANSFIRKPSSLEDLTSLIRLAYEYWSHCERPITPNSCG